MQFPQHVVVYRFLRCAALITGGVAVFVGVLPARAALADGQRWSEEVFYRKPLGRPYIVTPGRDLRRSTTVFGSLRYYQAQKGDTFLDIARYYDLGINELEEANPDIDPWLPPPGKPILLPMQWVLPDVQEYKGIVVNIPEMRLYYFRPAGADAVVVTTYPVGLGRDDWKTPVGKFTVREKTVNPVWVLPESIKQEHRKDGRPAPDFIPGGHPDNPLGKYRLRLSMPLYGIHGTNIPWGVGMQVSHGCIRLYPEDIEHLFPLVPVGTPGEFVYQPVKAGVRDGRVYLEVHKDIYDHTLALHREARRVLEKLGLAPLADAEKVKEVVMKQNGVPEDVTLERRQALRGRGQEGLGMVPRREGRVVE